MSANTEAGSAGIGDTEVQALEETVRRRCEEIEGLAHRSFSPGNTVCRESDLQLQAFAERRAEAFKTLDRTVGESRETRMARLERTLEKLECSRSFFAQTAGIAAGHYSDQ